MERPTKGDQQEPKTLVSTEDYMSTYLQHWMLGGEYTPFVQALYK